MCDYSLHGINNRLAVEGERLVVHRFRTGSVGMAAEADIIPAEQAARRPWQWLTSSGRRVPEADCAVCIPPGAALILRDVPQHLRNEFDLQEVEDVTFTQITASANSYRDAVRFSNGIELLLQRLDEGQRVDVINLSVSEPAEASQAEMHASDCSDAWRSTSWGDVLP